MFDEVNPILKNVDEAREFATMGSYEASLKSYSSARELITMEQKSCRSRLENDKWSSLLKDIIDEEVRIRKIKKFMNDIDLLLSAEDAKRQIFSDKRPDPGSKPDFVLLTNIANNKKPRNAQPSYDKPFRKNRRVSERKVSKSPNKQVKFNDDFKSKNDNDTNNDKNFFNEIVKNSILSNDVDFDWDLIAGLFELKKVLRQNLVILPMRPDFGQSLLSPWRTVLLYGPSGCGKTLLVKSIASESNRSFFNVSLKSILTRFENKSDKLFECIFSHSEKMKPSTIFIQGINSMYQDESGTLVRNQLFIEMQKINSTSNQNSIFFIASSDSPWNIDDSLLNNFQKHVYVPPPDSDARKQLILMNLEGLVDEKFDADMWADKLDNFSCSDITNICRDAAQRVVDAQTSMMDTEKFIQMPADQINYQVVVTNADFENSLMHRKPSFDQTVIKKYEDWGRSIGSL